MVAVLMAKWLHTVLLRNQWFGCWKHIIVHAEARTRKTTKSSMATSATLETAILSLITETTTIADFFQ